MADGRDWQGVREYISKGLKSATLTNTIWLGSSSVIAGMLGTVSSELIARALGVSEFGTLTLAITMMNLFIDLCDLGATSTFVRFGSQTVAAGNTDRFRKILSVVVRFKLTLASVVFLVALLFARPFVGHVFRHVNERIEDYFLLCMIPAGVGIAASIYYPIFQSFKNFRTHSVLSVIRVAFKLGLIGATILVFGTFTVSVGIWVEVWSVLLFLALNMFYAPVNAFRLERADKELARSVLSFNKWLLVYQLISIGSTRLDIFFVGGLADSNNLGLYGAASKIVGLVVAVTNSYYAVLIADISSHTTREHIRSRMRRAIYMVGIIVLALPILALLAKPLVLLLFGTSYTNAATILRIMCAGIAFQVLAYPVNAALYAYNRTEVFPLMGVASAVTIIAGNLYLIPKYGSAGAAVVFTLSALLSLAVSLGYYWWKRASLHDQSSDDEAQPSLVRME